MVRTHVRKKAQNLNNSGHMSGVLKSEGLEEASRWLRQAARAIRTGLPEQDRANSALVAEAWLAVKVTKGQGGDNRFVPV